MRRAILILLFSTAGCGDDCHLGESRCDGAQIWTCDETDIGGNAFRGLGACCAGTRVSIPAPSRRCPTAP